MKNLLGLILALVLASCSMPGTTPPSGDVMVAVGDGGRIARSLDHGQTWQVEMANPNLPSSKILNGNYVFGGNVRVLGQFNQGDQQRNVNSALGAGQIANAAGNSVAFAGDIYAKGTLYQQLGQQWVGPITNPFGTSTIFAIASNGSNVYVAVAAGGKIARSVDYGATWGSLIANNFAVVNILTIEYVGSNTFVAGAQDGTMSRSTDLGVTWSALIVNPFATAGGVVSGMKYGGGVLVAVGGDGGNIGKTSRSLDLGVTWSAFANVPFTGAVTNVGAIAYGFGVFVIGDAGGPQIARSTDLGQSWGSKITNPMANPIRSLAFGNAVLVAVGDGPNICRSVDLGISWGALIANSFTAGVFSVSYNFGIFQAGANNGQTSRSYDSGATWGGLLTNPFGANVIDAIASSPINMCSVGASASIATAGWNHDATWLQEQPYTPTFTGLGTCTAVNFTWVRLGNRVLIDGYFVSGICTAVKAKITLPNNLVSDPAIVPNLGAGFAKDYGTFTQQAVGVVSFYTLVESGVGYMTFGFQNAAAFPFTEQNGNAISPNNGSCSVHACLPISLWNV